MAIAEGAYGKVHLDKTGKIASKFMPLEDEGRFLPYYIVREVALLRKCERLQIPYIVRLLKFRIEKGFAILDFPLYRECLYSFLIREVSRTERLRVGKIALFNVLTALAGMHQAHILYRDCKPSNILIHENGKDIVLADFGGTRELLPDAADAQEPLILSPEVCTHLYAPREAFSSHYGPKADIYSLGVTIMQVMLGKPLPNEPIRDFMALKRDWRQLVPEPTIHELILRMVADQPQDRPSATEALAFLLGSSAWRNPVAFNPSFRNIGRYWESRPKMGFSGSLRRQTLQWLIDSADFLEVPQSLIIYMVQLFDDFLSRYAGPPLLLAQLPCLATAVLSLMLKFYSKTAPQADTLVHKLNVSNRFSGSDTQSWEKAILLTLNGALLPRPIPKLLARPLSLPILRRVLCHERYTITGELPNLLEEINK